MGSREFLRRDRVRTRLKIFLNSELKTASTASMSIRSVLLRTGLLHARNAGMVGVVPARLHASLGADYGLRQQWPPDRGRQVTCIEFGRAARADKLASSVGAPGFNYSLRPRFPLPIGESERYQLVFPGPLGAQGPRATDAGLACQCRSGGTLSVPAAFVVASRSSPASMMPRRSLFLRNSMTSKRGINRAGVLADHLGGSLVAPCDRKR